MTSANKPLRPSESSSDQDTARVTGDGPFDAAYRHLTGASGVAGGDELFDRIVAADRRARLLEIDLPELQVLRVEAEALGPAVEALAWWIDAIIAERLLLDFDPSSVLWATTRLHQMPTDPFLPVPVIYARARLRRIAVAGYLIEPTEENLGHFRRWRDASLDDFIRCGLPDEAVATRAVGAALTVIFTWDDVWDSLDRIKEARTQLVDPQRSSMGLLLEYLRAVVAFTAGDMVTAHQAFDEIEASGIYHPLLSFIVPFGRALAELIVRPDDPRLLAEIDRCIGDVARISPRYPAFYQHLVAQVLCDLRRPDARRYALAAMDMPPLGMFNRLEQRLLDIRMDTLIGVVPAAADVKHLLAKMEDHGHVRQAADMAMRIAWDIEALGQESEADALWSWGMERYPPPAERTVWEHLRARPFDRVHAASSPVIEVELCVMSPSLELFCRGERVPVTDLFAKLLVLLAASYPRPLSVEQLVDALWAEPLAKVSRTRLNTVVHRLRKLVGGDAPLVARHGDLLTFDPSGCRVDLFEVRGAFSATGADGARWLRSLRGNLCAAQFPDDERLLDERERFVGEWLEQVRGHRFGAAELDALEPALAALGLARRDIGS